VFFEMIAAVLADCAKTLDSQALIVLPAEERTSVHANRAESRTGRRDPELG
jgi:hypothetical protein